MILSGWVYAIGLQIVYTGRLFCYHQPMSSETHILWDRVARVVAHRSSGHARYPALLRVSGGRLLLAFTQQTKEQDSGRADLLLVRSDDGGASWSDPQTIYRGRSGEPRAPGTLSVLAAGRLGFAFAEYVGQQAHRLGVLFSDDSGVSWQETNAALECDLLQPAPNGNLIQHPAMPGTVLMTVQGATSADDAQSAVSSCKLLVWTDDGDSWTEYATLAIGNSSVLGAPPKSRFSFTAPAIQILPDGRWLAVVTARRLGQWQEAGAGAPLILCRLYSDDGGRSWSMPEQLTVGGGATLAMIDDETVACPFSCWATFGQTQMLLSTDGMESFDQEADVMCWGWVGGYTVDEMPLAANGAVPDLHFGFPSVCQVGDRRFAVAFGRTQAHSRYWHGAEQLIVPEGEREAERIDVVFYAPSPWRVQTASKSASRPRKARRWVLTDRFRIPHIGMVTRLTNGHFLAEEFDADRKPKRFVVSADGGRSWRQAESARVVQQDSETGSLFWGSYDVVLGVLRSGRWLMAYRRSYKEDAVKPVCAGTRHGYPVFEATLANHDLEALTYYSDDEGHTWTAGQVLREPFAWVCPYGRFLELDDGTVLLTGIAVHHKDQVPFYGASSIVFRSVDGGQSWTDPSVVFAGGSHTREFDFQPQPRHNEVDVIQLASGRLLGISRSEFFSMGPEGGVISQLCRATSDDGGLTWSRPEIKLRCSGGQQKLVALPDGGVAVVVRTHSWQRPGVYLSYDEACSFDYALTGTHATTSAEMHGKDEFVVFTYPWGTLPAWAAAYRRLSG